MAGWSGFSDDDLRKMRQTSEKDDPVNSHKRVTGPRQQQQQKGKYMRASQSDIHSEPTTAKQKITDKIDQSMRLSSSDKTKGGENLSSDRSKGDNLSIDRSRTNTHETRSTTETRELLAGEKSIADSGNNKVDNVKLGDRSSSIDDHVTHPGSSDIKELDENEAFSAELVNVQKFQQRQKVIEEANKRKRELLSKAIEDRRKKAKAEAAKLMTVQQELNHLDTLLTADVSIIRDKIEVASLEYMDAQKRYEKAEKEFVAAKIDLFSKGESKERLTEHLYTIIHQNEVRKARKLVELMEKLAMEVTPEEMELTIPAIPQLTNFTAVSTLHDPYHVKTAASVEGEKADAVGINPSSDIALSAAVVIQEIKASLPNTLVVNDIESNSHDMKEETTNIVLHNVKCTSETQSSSVEKDSVQQQNEMLKQANVEPAQNNHPETASRSATSLRADDADVTQSTFHSPESNNNQVETDITEADNLVDVYKGESTLTHGTLTSPVDIALPGPASEVHGVLSDKVATSQVPSLNISSGKGWTLPFS